MKTETLKEFLREWRDQDYIEFHLAILLGILDSDVSFLKAKHLFWTANPVGDALGDVIVRLVKAGVLEEDPSDYTRFRWNRSFKP
jgi:hypothetical protein